MLGLTDRIPSKGGYSAQAILNSQHSYRLKEAGTRDNNLVSGTSPGIEVSQ